jgi:glycosyltransferase involved in cell wall biosynthesis
MGANGDREPDVLIVSLASTSGLGVADRELARSLERAGATAFVFNALRPADVRTLMLTDLLWALSARRTARKQLSPVLPRAVVYSSTTAALLWPAPGAIRFDAPSAGNRPGRHGLWQRPLERLRLRQAPLLLPWSEGGLHEAPAAARRGDRALVLPVPVEPFRASDWPDTVTPGAELPGGERDIAAITYAANPIKKGFDRVLAAWRRVRRPSEELVVAGARADDLQRAGLLSPDEEGVCVVGLLPPWEYRPLLRRSRVFVCAPRREDYGIAQLEALAEGCMLVTTAAPGPYVALPLARSLDPRLVGDDLGAALRLAIDDPAPDYALRASSALTPFSRAAVDRLVADELLPRLLPSSGA